MAQIPEIEQKSVWIIFMESYDAENIEVDSTRVKGIYSSWDKAWAAFAAEHPCYGHDAEPEEEDFDLPLQYSKEDLEFPDEACPCQREHMRPGFGGWYVIEEFPVDAPVSEVVHT